MDINNICTIVSVYEMMEGNTFEFMKGRIKL